MRSSDAVPTRPRRGPDAAPTRPRRGPDEQRPLRYEDELLSKLLLRFVKKSVSRVDSLRV
jgi:hypothetical protein